jgi:hypothetical protein
MVAVSERVPGALPKSANDIVIRMPWVGERHREIVLEMPGVTAAVVVEGYGLVVQTDPNATRADLRAELIRRLDLLPFE